jgi:hypothetical protein
VYERVKRLSFRFSVLELRGRCIISIWIFGYRNRNGNELRRSSAKPRKWFEWEGMGSTYEPDEGDAVLPGRVSRE